MPGFPTRQSRLALNARKRPFSRAFSGVKGPRMGAEPAGREPGHSVAALEVTDSYNQLKQTLFFTISPGNPGLAFIAPARR